jgi:hypothetical protein
MEDQPSKVVVGKWTLKGDHNHGYYKFQGKYLLLCIA